MERERSEVSDHARLASLARSRCWSHRLALALPSRRPQRKSVADFYRGKTITCFIGYGVGGGYDLFARTISRHMSRHIPGNPTILPVNMPGASSLVLGNHLAKRAPRDGTAIGAVNSALLFDTLFAGAEFEGPVQWPRDDHARQCGELGGGADRLAHHRHQDASTICARSRS